MVKATQAQLCVSWAHMDLSTGATSRALSTCSVRRDLVGDVGPCVVSMPAATGSKIRATYPLLWVGSEIAGETLAPTVSRPSGEVLPTTRSPDSAERYIRIWGLPDKQRDAYPEGLTYRRVGRTSWFRYTHDVPMTRSQAQGWLREVAQRAPRGWKYDILRVS